MFNHDRMSVESSPTSEGKMLENRKEVLKALVPQLVEMLRGAVRRREPYELAFERILNTGENDSHLSKEEGFALRGAVTEAYKEVSVKEASLPGKTFGSSVRLSGRIPRRSTAEDRKNAVFSSRDRAAGAEAEARHDEQIQS